MSAVEMVYVRRISGKEGRTNVCGREGACERMRGD